MDSSTVHQTVLPEQGYYFDGFFSSIYMIVLSELGDKTFFVAAILSVNNPRLLVYIGAMGAMITMTLISSLIGLTINIIPKHIVMYVSALMFLLFGLKMLKDAYEMSSEDAKEEFEEVQQTYSNFDVEVGMKSAKADSIGTRIKICIAKFLPPIVVEAFIINFLCEWGDRSQIATIILSTTGSIVGVVFGAILGHALCTGLAVLAGRIISYKVPVKWLTFLGGITFILFAIHSVWEAHL